MWKKSETGQTLIEAVITLGVALVIIGSIVALANASNRRATLARQSTQASKLAEEGMEIVRNIKDVNFEEAVWVGPTCSALPVTNRCSWNDLYENKFPSPINAKLRESGILATQCGFTNSWCLESQAPSDSSDDELIFSFYHRTIEISDDPPTPGGDICAEPTGTDPISLGFQDIKKITVVVAWDSPIGSQKRTVVSCLSKK